MYKNIIKPFFDVFAALCGLLILSPILLIIVALLCVANNGSPFFIQKRLGKNNKVFKIYKFKTMNDKKNLAGNLLPDEQRLTKIGKIIRKTSLDEIPQLFNVLIGQMSLIGPRPLLPEYIPYYTKEQSRRHHVVPGITGWAQINGRNTLSWEKKFEYDVWYVDNLNFALDVKIIVLTIINILSSKDITPEGTATMPRLDDVVSGNAHKN